jgi:hypothetical protein
MDANCIISSINPAPPPPLTTTTAFHFLDTRSNRIIQLVSKGQNSETRAAQFVSISNKLKAVCHTDSPSPPPGGFDDEKGRNITGVTSTNKCCAACLSNKSGEKKLLRFAGAPSLASCMKEGYCSKDFIFRKVHDRLESVSETKDGVTSRTSDREELTTATSSETAALSSPSGTIPTSGYTSSTTTSSLPSGTSTPPVVTSSTPVDIAEEWGMDFSLAGNGDGDSMDIEALDAAARATELQIEKLKSEIEMADKADAVNAEFHDAEEGLDLAYGVDGPRFASKGATETDGGGARGDEGSEGASDYGLDSPRPARKRVYDGMLSIIGETNLRGNNLRGKRLGEGLIAEDIHRMYDDRKNSAPYGDSIYEWLS